MQFNIRNNDKYLDVRVTIDNAVIDLGLLDNKERIELAITLISTAEELLNTSTMDL